MNSIDIVSLIIVIGAGIRCMIRGFVTEILRVGSVIVGLWCAIFFTGRVKNIAEQFISPSNWNTILVFLAIFIIVYLLFKLGEGVLVHVTEKMRITNLNRALGLLLGIIEGLTIVTVLLLMLYVQPLFPIEDILTKSTTSRVISPLLPYATNIIQQRMLDVL